MSPRRACLALLLLAFSLPALAAGDPSSPESRMDKPAWAARYTQKQVALQHGLFDFVLLGDSITQELERPGPAFGTDFTPVWQHWFACHHTIDLGFAGDTTANLIWRIDNNLLPATPPRAVMLMIGTNNNQARLGWSANDTAHAIIGIVASLHRRWPATRIVVLGVPPNGHGPTVNATIVSVDATLAAADWATDNARFVPIADVLAPGGTLDTALFRETAMGHPALHPNADGWERIAARAAPALSAALGAPAACTVQ